MKKNLPIVAIIGRPNVGKSSLFNLLLGERKSIVDEEEGVTRDINIGIVNTERIAFYLYDTAGYLEKGDSFNSLIQAKVREAIANTELILFVVDGREVHPYDEDLAKFLQKQEKKVLVIANKLDNREMEDLHYEFFRLGFNDILPFSVLHKRGYSTLIEWIEDNLKYSSNKVKEENPQIHIAIVGKPNVGKSLLVNTILGYERSIVSDLPGTTRDSIDDIFEYNGKKICLIDTAGLRRKAKIENDIEYYSNVRTIQAIERSEVVILLLDSMEGISQQDKKIVDMIMEKGRGLVIAYNKWDLKRVKSDENYRLMEDYKKFTYKEIGAYNFVPVEFISAKDNYRISKLLDTALRVYEDFYYRVPTNILNEWVEQNIKESYNRKQVSNLRIYYAAQVYSAPPRFVFFVNKKDYMRKDYPRYMENRIREAFEFTGVPIKINFREKKENIK